MLVVFFFLPTLGNYERETEAQQFADGSNLYPQYRPSFILNFDLFMNSSNILSPNRAFDLLEEIKLLFTKQYSYSLAYFSFSRSESAILQKHSPHNTNTPVCSVNLVHSNQLLKFFWIHSDMTESRCCSLFRGWFPFHSLLTKLVIHLLFD